MCRLPFISVVWCTIQYACALLSGLWCPRVIEHAYVENKNLHSQQRTTYTKRHAAAAPSKYKEISQ